MYLSLPVEQTSDCNATASELCIWFLFRWQAGEQLPAVMPSLLRQVKVLRLATAAQIEATDAQKTVFFFVESSSTRWDKCGMFQIWHLSPGVGPSVKPTEDENGH